METSVKELLINPVFHEKDWKIFASQIGLNLNINRVTGEYFHQRERKCWDAWVQRSLLVDQKEMIAIHNRAIQEASMKAFYLAGADLAQAIQELAIKP